MEITVSIIEHISYDITVTIDNPEVAAQIAGAVDGDGCAEPGALPIQAWDAIEEQVAANDSDAWSGATVDHREWSIVVAS